MPGNFDRTPIDVIAGAIGAGEDEVRKAEECVDQCQRALAGAQAELDITRRHLAAWREAAAKLTGFDGG